MGSIIDISEVLLELGLSSSVTEEERAICNTAIVRAEGAVKRFLHYDPAQRRWTSIYPQMDRDHQSGAAVWEVDDSHAILRRVASASTSELQMQHLPIREQPTAVADPSIDLRIDYSARSGTADGAFPDSSLKTEGSDYWANYDGEDSSGNKICHDGIIRSFGRWPTTPGTVRVVYTAGYTAEELHGQDAIVDASPIMDAALEEAVRRVKKAYMRMKAGGVGFVAGPITSERLGDYSYTIDASAASMSFGGLWDVLPETMQKLEGYVNMGYALGS